MYLPKVEALEALRLLNAATPTLGPLVAEHFPVTSSPAPIDQDLGHDAWDAALSQTRLADLLAPAVSPVPTAPAANDPAAISSGLSQLDRYLARTWSRAGISPQGADDCTQAVYTTLLQNWGRNAFDGLLAEVGTIGIRATLSRDTPDGPDFFRAIDTVKKRAQREKSFAPLNEGANVAGSDGASESWRGALHEAIDRNLSPREAALIHATLQGETPAEIALQWGVAPKTVSNEKTRAIQKLREALVADLAD
ncbi:MAG: DNA-directed polymerase specialized sigma subunit, sigma24 [Planctomycetota bacterium]|nr:DNA-directed polymerase specialized sigma subunit, sigma24 [Planctomycetota bacterium]